VRGRPYERTSSDPRVRPLRIFALDPAESRLDGAIAVVDIAYEPLRPGPIGALFEVVDPVGPGDENPGAVDLDAASRLLNSGRVPSPSDMQFHQQMVYAVCSEVYATFRAALGRDLAWGFDRDGSSGDGRVRLRILPHAPEGTNACYDRARGELRF